MAQCLGAGRDDGRTVQGSDGDRSIVDDAVDDHVDNLGIDLDRVGGHLGQFVGQLLLTGQIFLGRVRTYGVLDGHGESFLRSVTRGPVGAARV